MKHLSDESLKIIESLMPPQSAWVVIVATKEGTGVDTNITPSKAREFVLETGNWMSAETLQPGEKQHAGEDQGSMGASGADHED